MFLMTEALLRGPIAYAFDITWGGGELGANFIEKGFPFKTLMH